MELRLGGKTRNWKRKELWEKEKGNRRETMKGRQRGSRGKERVSESER